MSDLAPPPVPPPAPPVIMGLKTLSLNPTFLGALRGIWLFTWKSQLTWRRMPTLILCLLILPTLIYITTLSPKNWNLFFPWIGRPPSDLRELSSRLSRANTPLSAKQSSELLQFYTQEFERAESARNDALSPEESAALRMKEMRACHDRIVQRAQSVLDESQYAQFQNYENHRLTQQLSRNNGPNWGRTGPFYHWLIDLYFFVVLPLVCVRGAGALIRDELQADTLCFLTTRPVSRARLLVLKYLSQTAWLQILLIAQLLLMMLAGALRVVPALGALLPLFALVQLLAVPAWCALGVFLGQVTQRYLAVALVYGFVVELGIGRIPTNINTLSLMRHLKSLLSHNAALQGVFDWTARGVPFSVVAVMVGTGIFLGLAALMFTFKEYHHTTEMQK